MAGQIKRSSWADSRDFAFTYRRLPLKITASRVFCFVTCGSTMASNLSRRLRRPSFAKRSLATRGWKRHHHSMTDMSSMFALFLLAFVVFTFFLRAKLHLLPFGPIGRQQRRRCSDKPAV